jgi:predicted RNA methylase
VRRAAALLSRGSASRILDVGSGVGKFCTVAALTTPGAFIGIERQGELVDVARETAHRARAAKARFIHARIEDIDWTNFDGFYLFNPFAELGWKRVRAAQGADADRAEYDRAVSFTEESLFRARSGARVVTYHGFGGEMPSSFRLLVREPYGTDFLECWQKA